MPNYNVKSTLTLLLLTNFLFAQQKDTLINGILFDRGLTFTDSIQMGLVKETFYKPVENKKNENKASVYIPVLPFIDLFSGISYRIGSEVKIHNIFSAYFEGGSFFYNQPNGSWLENVTGGVGKIGLKIYLNKNKLSAGKYIAIDYLYKNVEYLATDSIRIDKNPSFQKKYKIEKFVNAFAIKYGETFFVGSRIIIDLYAGIGVRFINSHKDLNKLEENGILYGEGNGSLTGSAVRTSGTVPNINAGLKIGYRIKK
jgi:hypothetical protein